MTASPHDETDRDGSMTGRTVTVIAVEILVILALWWFGRAFA